MWENAEKARDILIGCGLVALGLVVVVSPLWWTVYRVLRPVDRAARERNLPFRFSMGDFLCLFWIVQLPLAFVYRFGSVRSRGSRGDDNMDQYYWILTAAVWFVAPLAWFTVARALSKAGVSAGLHRMIFLGLVLPTVYYGLFPLIGITIAGLSGIFEKGVWYLWENKRLLAMWCALAGGIIACGFYSPWMVGKAGAKNVETPDDDEALMSEAGR